MAGVTFDGVSKVDPGGTRAVGRLNLGIQDGEFGALVGPLGCVFVAFQRSFVHGLLAGSVR